MRDTRELLGIRVHVSDAMPPDTLAFVQPGKYTARIDADLKIRLLVIEPPRVLGVLSVAPG